MAATDLDIQETRFTLNGKPTFLHGISFYGALGASEENIKRDLQDMNRYGINWIRMWATWSAFEKNVSAVSENGGPREPFLKKLKWLVAECDRQGIVVDVTLSRGDGATGSPRLQSLEEHRRAVETIVAALKPHRNWYLDLGNERNIRDTRYVSFEDLKALRQAVRGIDPRRLVTASQGGDIDRNELREYLMTVEVDFICPHRPRDPESPGDTEAKTREYLSWMKETGRVVPVHYQEPFRRDYGDWQPEAEDYWTDQHGAKEGGAAGWCLHNGSRRAGPDGIPRRSFDMREKRLFDQLDDEEMQALKLLTERKE